MLTYLSWPHWLIKNSGTNHGADQNLPDTHLLETLAPLFLTILQPRRSLIPRTQQMITGTAKEEKRTEE
jgi:hypothetical protein